MPLTVQPVLDHEGQLKDTMPLFRPVSPAQEMVWLLWRYIFSEVGWKRLKRCRVCTSWYEDQTKNRSQPFCGEACLNRYWTRARRRAARKRKPRARFHLERLKRQEARERRLKKTPAK